MDLTSKDGKTSLEIGHKEDGRMKTKRPHHVQHQYLPRPLQGLNNTVQPRRNHEHSHLGEQSRWSKPKNYLLGIFLEGRPGGYFYSPPEAPQYDPQASSKRFGVVHGGWKFHLRDLHGYENQVNRPQRTQNHQHCQSTEDPIEAVQWRPRFHPQ